MDASTAAFTPTEAAEAKQKLQAEQQLRKRRLAMSFASYMVTFTVVAFCWYQGMIPLRVLAHYLMFSIAINLGFLVAFQTNLNLRFRDPSLTAVQMVASLLPALYVMYFLDAGQARAIFLFIAIVPALYGILALNTRQFLAVVLIFFLLYGALMVMLHWQRPQVLSGPLELLQLFALMLVLAQIAVIGGFINGLREKLRHRNRELQSAMEELNSALARIQELASRDALTGVFNRRHLFYVMAKEINRQRRANGPFSVCILDIDFFKQVNDQYGHIAGDEVLKRVAEAVMNDLRNIDCFGRYGGEEFLLILPQTSLEGARIKAERVRQQIETLRFPSIDNAFRITVSIGVAEHWPEEEPDNTINRADSALYEAKTQGRNRIVIADAF
ncbi:GGDEF domain-containing protein [Mangrovitalea sediminis]|uniref:GGDEF domain-containing protein n=1 Tax=Mangrovitalea sediminis TaxID=1982043 RepID=UPI000BE4C000|nr:diguanylate cyclase [Mangrovitalea sediminis]